MKKVHLTVVLATVATLAACSGDTVAPRQQDADSAPRFGGGATAALTGSDKLKFSITIDPWHTTYYALGDGNAITFPAGSVCETSSSYGATEWDSPCTASRKSIKVDVTAWLDAAGHARVDFQPHLRFVPSVLPSDWVNITFTDMQASLSPWYNILYCPKNNYACYDESKTDPTLVTVRNAVNGQVTRRIKHFSGYMVGAGDDGSGLFNRTSPGTSRLSSGGATQPEARTGYMLASGRKEQ